MNRSFFYTSRETDATITIVAKSKVTADRILGVLVKNSEEWRFQNESK